jgi:hypothetical protein
MSFTSDKARDGIGDAGDGEGGVGNGVAARGAGGDARLAGMPAWRGCPPGGDDGVGRHIGIDGEESIRRMGVRACVGDRGSSQFSRFFCHYLRISRERRATRGRSDVRAGRQTINIV